MVTMVILSTSTGLLRWIVLAPLVGALLNIFFGRRWGGRSAGILASGAVAASFFLSLAAIGSLPPGGTLRDLLFTWIESGPFRVSILFEADALTAVMLLIVTGIGLLIHVYSIGYMEQDKGMVRYFAYLNLFVFFMLLLVTAGNLALLFVGWEGVGLCSYLLIGFWHQDHANAVAANKAFIVNRIGDFGFLLGILVLFWEMDRVGVPSLDFSYLRAAAPLLASGKVTLITLLLFWGATGKSAQIPLYVWLPDAMRGPTPVSALIHAATMVTAGVYMIARLHFLFSLAPVTLHGIAVIGALTAFFAATIAVAQNDIKRVLAYSTVSQLGYMFLALGTGAFAVAVFHLFTHAFFKACLFLSAGSVIHALGGEQDMRRMGGLKRDLPVTYWSTLISALALAGAPLTAGFFSKDLILWQAFAGPQGSLALWFLAWVTAGLTAFYIFRQFFMVFHGERRVTEEVKAHLHESPQVMTAPLILLALGALFAGWVGAPEYMGGNLWNRWLAPVFGPGPVTHAETLIPELSLMILTLAIAAAGIYLAYRTYGREGKISSWKRYEWLQNSYYIDQFYDSWLVQPFAVVAQWLARRFDPNVIDGIVNGIARHTMEWSILGRRLQTGNVQHYLLGFLIGALLLLGYLV